MNDEKIAAMMGQIFKPAIKETKALIREIGSGCHPNYKECRNRMAKVIVVELLKMNSGELCELLACIIADENLRYLARMVVEMGGLPEGLMGEEPE